jgi:hydrogenase maturation protease
VLAVGNPSRGDDAIGPGLAARLEAAALPGVEVITEFQLQVENALDLVGRERVIFVDAGAGTPAPFDLRRATPAADFLHTSHALSPEAVLATYERVTGASAPESWVLCVPGEVFDLGAELSPAASDRLATAWPALRLLCQSATVTEQPSVPYDAPPAATDAEILDRARAFRDLVQRRRTVRDFSPRPVARAVIEACIAAAGSAPSGANQQPWHFVAVADPEVKHRIRVAAESEEREFYERRAPAEWLEALRPIGTDWRKPFLETAPWLIAIFVRRWGRDADGGRLKHYYPAESVGIATGLLITALHSAGLATLTHTPSPMRFLNEILGRPADVERPFLLLVAGHPAPGARVPDIARSPPAAIATWFETG